MVSLIGISGKIGSGKDLMFHILGYLAQEDDWKNFSDYMSNAFFIHRKYENKKFAYPIKWIVSVLIGCDIRQLEDREFKEKELGEEWTKNIFDGLGIIEEIDEETGEYVYSDQRGKELGNVVRGGKDCYKDFNITLTPRKLLQLLGTEAGRNIIHPNIWVNALFADYVCNDCGQKECPTDEEDTGQMIHRSFPNWIITDCRFPNEAQAIKDRGGIVIRVERKPFNRAGGMEGNKQFSEQIKEDTHPSETALDDYEFDYVIENDGSIEDLVDKIRKLNIV